jgi:hypothetical protein
MTTPEARAARALELLDAMAETWVEKHGIAQMIQSVPVNCPTPEFQARAHALILRHVKQAYAEGLYAGRMSVVDETTK